MNFPLITGALVLLAAVAMPVSAQTTYNLTSDPLDVDTSYVKIRVDGNEQSACGTVATPCTIQDGEDLHIAYDLTAFANTGADLTIDAAACDAGGNCSPWSVPLVTDLTAPGVPGGLRVVVNVTVTVQ